MKLFTGIIILSSFRVTKVGQNVMSPSSCRRSLGCKILVAAFSGYSRELVLVSTLSFGGMVISIVHLANFRITLLSSCYGLLKGSRELFSCNARCLLGRIRIVAYLGYILRVPVGIAAIVWVDVCRIVVIYQGNGPESGSEGSCVIRIPNKNWFLD